ncbi:MAG: hypothetical protein KA731_01710 [Candidatus Moranbacteria bacterium]|nr:hypothetical protein [Candidatus Moranbacteria bacterium]
MPQPLTSLYKQLPEPDMPSGLEGKVLARLAELRQQEARRALVWSYARLALSFVLALSGIFFAGSALLGSEFVQLLSVFLSDVAWLSASGSNLLWFFLETFPAWPLALFLAPIFLLLVSIGMHASVEKRYHFQQSSLVIA